MTGPNLDPDSYWMPQADCALTQSESAPTLNLARQTLIFRSARMPNIGYLQYLRTGIIPDDEDSVPYISQQRYTVPASELCAFHGVEHGKSPGWPEDDARRLAGLSGLGFARFALHSFDAEFLWPRRKWRSVQCSHES